MAEVAGQPLQLHPGNFHSAEQCPFSKLNCMEVMPYWIILHGHLMARAGKLQILLLRISQRNHRVMGPGGDLGD
jgi:hypothetical protein